jgi:outer membrane protein OmpA-like peptidoglycan-associated protein
MKNALLKLTLTAAALAFALNVQAASISGHAGYIKLMSPETNGSGFFSLNLSTLLGVPALDDSLGIKSSNFKKYFQSTNHLSLNVSLGNYIDIGAKGSFAIDSRDYNDENLTIQKLNNIELGVKASFKRNGIFRMGMYLYGNIPVVKDKAEIEDFVNFSEVTSGSLPANTTDADLRYYNYRKFSDEFLFNPMASFGGKLMTSIGNDYFKVIMNGGYLWRTATERDDVNFQPAKDIDILPDVWTLGAGADIYLSDYVRMFFEWDGEMFVDKENKMPGDTISYSVCREEFPQRVGGGFKFVGNKNFAATLGGFGGLNKDAPDWQVYLGLTFSGNWIDPDTDGDGILDEMDMCPNEPEDFDGFEDEDGCPDPDNDGDGIPDHLDQCPNDAEDKDGFEDEDGCPDPDNDGDGIADSVDKCPNEPEDFDGFEDIDGCPDPDNDKDRICDPWVAEKGLSEKYAHICTGSDKCPDEAEDFDGFEDSDGCPEYDNDGDGIPDYLDKCPNEAETFNGFEDDDGCPDAIVLKKDERILLDNIYFKLGSAELEPESFDTLNSMRRVFLDNPGIVIQIEGHTDSQGSDEYNLKLSQARAETVSNYIIYTLGISSSQVSGIGYGESRPVAPNSTSKGRAQNRRIEFRVISTR